MFIKEVSMPFGKREILYLVGHGVTDTSCCGFWGCAYALVCKFILSWKKKRNGDGVPISEVEPIRDMRIQADIRRRIEDEEMVLQIIFCEPTFGKSGG